MLGWAVRQLLIWCGIALALYVVVSRQWGNRPAAPDATAAAVVTQQEPSRQRSAMPNSLVFRANDQGHVVLDAAVNGAPVRFLVDTGATLVALSLQDAAAAGLGAGDLRYRGSAATANGMARVAPVMLRELRIGQFAADDVPAIVMDNLPISLLGQSFLKRLDSYEMRGGVLTLYWD